MSLPCTPIYTFWVSQARFLYRVPSLGSAFGKHRVAQGQLPPLTAAGVSRDALGGLEPLG